MEEQELGNIMTYTLGKNTTRIKASESSLYTPEDFDDDLHSTRQIKPGECIINLIRPQAGPITGKYISKELTSNFLRCTFDSEAMDVWYFCYQFNASRYLKQQINRFNQGNTASVKKLNIKMIGELKIKLPEMEKQKIIGELYRFTLRQEALMQQQVTNMTKLSLETISQIEEAK